MSMQESCLLVCRPCFNTMKLWTFDPNLHLSPVDTTFCLISCKFSFSLVCPHPCFCVFHIYHVYLRHAFIMWSLHLFLPLLAYWFLVFAFACTHMERWRMELVHGLSGASKRDADASMWLSQTVVVSRFRSLASPLWLCTLLNLFLPPQFLP